MKSNGRAFRGALLAGLASSLGWNLLLHRPWGIDGAVVGMACNLLVFTIRTRQFQKYRAQKLLVCPESRTALPPSENRRASAVSR